MKTLLPALVLSLVIAVVSYTQTPAPSPTATPDAGDVVKISTALIQVDVTVTDKSGRVVTDLRPDEVEIYENGKKQDISHFTFISNIRENVDRPKPDKSQPQAVLPPASAVKPEQVRRTIALVVDDLTLSFESTYFVRRALKRFVDEQMQDGDLVAIIRTGAGVGALQQFTNDRRQLYAAIENVKWNATGAGGIGAFAPLEPTTGGEDDDRALPGERTEDGIRREFDDFRTSIFATGTLGAINYVVRGMSELPGRKSVLLLSDGFRLFTKDASGTIQTTRMLDALRRLVDQANRASVVIYTMDARGLQVTSLTAADDTSGRTPAQVRQEIDERNEMLRDTQDGLRYLARQTGGIAIINNNDLSGGIRRVLDDQSYYLVGYEPDTDTFDPKTRRFNRLDVRVTRPGTRVRYRSGFFGVAEENIKKPADTGNQKLLNALTSPFAVNDIDLRLNTLFGGSANGSFVRSLLHIDAKDLNFTDEPDGTKKVVFDLIAVNFGDSGGAVDQISKTFTAKFSKETQAVALEKGFVYDFTFPMKKPGAYQLRVAIRDHGTNKVGSANQFIEVPNLKKKRLTLSGVVLENIPYDAWQKRVKGNESGVTSDPLRDTSVRRFKQGTVLNYGFSIYNAKTAAGGTPSLTAQVRLFLNGKPIFEGTPQPVTGTPADLGFTGSLSLASQMEPGEYVLQVTVTDNLEKGKKGTANQFVQFEVVPQ